MRPYQIKIQPGSTEEISVPGSYVRVDNALVPVIIETRDGQNKVTLREGNAVKLENGFDGLRISHASGIEQNILLYVSDQGEIEANNIAGTVSVDNWQGPFTQGRVSLTNANQAIVAANAARRYLLIQNNDASAIMRINLAGVAATAAQGIRLEAGESLELVGFQSTAAINAIMETASAAADNVEIVEG